MCTDKSWVLLAIVLTFVFLRAHVFSFYFFSVPPFSLSILKLVSLSVAIDTC